ncbi:hypothetical protein EON73_05625 [bacterium]|nr:MAG: hypothetical protein EON73_05625 [bacterium]
MMVHTELKKNWSFKKFEFNIVILGFGPRVRLAAAVAVAVSSPIVVQNVAGISFYILSLFYSP